MEKIKTEYLTFMKLQNSENFGPLNVLVCF